MAKSKPKIIDQGSAMERILGLKKPEADQSCVPVENPVAHQPVQPIQSVETVQSVSQGVKQDRSTKKEKYVQTAFYITPAQHKALKLRAVQSDDPKDKDMSAIVRAALDMYLK